VCLKHLGVEREVAVAPEGALRVSQAPEVLEDMVDP